VRTFTFTATDVDLWGRWGCDKDVVVDEGEVYCDFCQLTHEPNFIHPKKPDADL
jgi:hypothetical protein